MYHNKMVRAGDFYSFCILQTIHWNSFWNWMLYYSLFCSFNSSETKCRNFTYATFHPKSCGVYNLLLNFRLFSLSLLTYQTSPWKKQTVKPTWIWLIIGHHFGIMWHFSVSQKLMNDCAKFAQEDLFLLFCASGLNEHQHMIKSQLQSQKQRKIP